MWQAWPVHRFCREDSLRRLGEEEFDVLVIGGGVTGAGVALDAASRGLRTALVEKEDFASGTSSKSSKMVHGGLRYLQQREFRLVYENLAERQRLLDNAPHLVAPLPFLIPLFGRDGVVSKTVARSYSTALWLYDITGGWRIGARHRRLDKAQALAHLPTLNADHLVAGFLYFDARADDARLTLTLARTAALEHGAVVANYTPVLRLTTDARGAANGAVVRPDPGDDSTEFAIRARVVVNATGVWADDVRAMDGGTFSRSIRPAKGVHVTVPADRLPCDIAAVIPVPKDRRSIFVVPWPDTDLVYLGTTDTDYQGPLDDPACTPEDVDYLLDAANNLTTSRLTRADVTGLWAGLRPLLAPGKKGGHLSERTADLSRRHTVRTSEQGVVTVTGGKLTTYRKMSQDTVDAVVRRLGESPRDRRCITKSLRLIGATTKNRDPVAQAHPRAHLVARYGTESAAVLALAEGRPELLDPVVAGLPYTGAEVLYAAREEMARTLEDVLARRTRAMIQLAQATMAAAPRVAGLMAPDMGWDEGEAADQVARFIESCQKELLTAGLDLP
ncbi:MAG TPA: glycerol-3-phosphate dehydrogenase/oxidase [Acidimicrobiales bacterium]|nr:glycerol-3-phosphate dehydrogenase/oxidase [Acidimicrobiales bacterium]